MNVVTTAGPAHAPPNLYAPLAGDLPGGGALLRGAPRGARPRGLIGEATNRVCEGELRQGLERGNLELSERDYFEIIEGKTAELIACCCYLGAVYGGAGDAVADCLGRYGRWLGIAFQIA